MENSRAVTSLTFCADGISLASGSEDGLIRIWDTGTRNIVRMLKHGKGMFCNTEVFIRMKLQNAFLPVLP